jgi:hypothetical protein
MSKFGCPCGSTIRDQSDHLSYKAYYITDSNYEEYYEEAEKEIDDFIKSIKEDFETKWVEKRFGLNYPKNLNYCSIIDDIITKYRLKYESNIYQCENCGRVFFEKKNKLIAFLPEDKMSKNIFRD